MKVWDEDRWVKADPNSFDGSLVKKVQKKKRRIRFKMGGTWYSTREGCLEAGGDEGRKRRPEVKGEKGQLFLGLGGTLLAESYQGGSYSQFSFSYGAGVSFSVIRNIFLKIQLNRLSQSTRIPLLWLNETTDQFKLYDSELKQSFTELAVIPAYHSKGFYFGPQLGLAMLSQSIRQIETGSQLSLSSTLFEFGLNFGARVSVAQSMFLSPDFHYTRILAPSIALTKTSGWNVFKGLLLVGLRF